MNIMTYTVPEGITKLSQWSGFKDIIPPGKCILNKKVTGCGATTYFLDENNPTPIILCSHRTELLTCKAEAPRHEKFVHLFKQPEDKDVKALQENMKKLREYLDRPMFHKSPFSDSKVYSPKILVTTDSLKHVLSVLKDRGELDDYTVVSDECQCILTDASFKGDVVLNYINDLQIVKNVIYLSATPILEEYLDELTQFKDLPYIQLEWPNEVEAKLKLCPLTKTTIRKALNEKIKFYKTNGFFEENMHYRATEAVFFINSVADIIFAINDNNLDPSEVNVVCSRADEKQKKKLKELGFNIGRPPKEGQPHKPITFVTKCAFEGVDFYNTNAYTYIFANPNRENLSIDIGIDIHQILGRQRLMENPWWNCATLYFKKTKPEEIMTQEEFDNIQKEKELYSLEKASFINSENSSYKSIKIEELNDLHNLHYFEKDYLTVITDSKTGIQKAVINELVKVNEKRAYRIKNREYVDEYKVLSEVRRDFDITNETLQPIITYFYEHRDFVDRMKYYCQFRMDNPCLVVEMENSIAIPSKFGKYYDQIGPDKIKSVSYKEENIKSLLKESNMTDEVSLLIHKKFDGISRILKSDAKSILQEIYDSLELKKIAKATDLSIYYEISNTDVTVNGKRSKGFKILSIK